MQHSLGLMEVTGLSLAITVADVMAKTASVRLLGVERTIGSGWMLVKIDGDVASVRTALAAGEETARRCSGFVACTTIARPAKGTGDIVSPRLRQAERVKEDIAVAMAAIENAMADFTAAPETLAGGVSTPTETTVAEINPAAVADRTADAAGYTASAPDHEAEAVSAVTVAADNSPAAVADKTADAADTAAGTLKTAPASPGAVQAACKICGDPLCGRHKGEPRSKCIHYQKPVLR